MKWFAALLLGALFAVVLPQVFGGQEGLWMNSAAKWGTVRPLAGSPGLLFSIPAWVGSAIALRLFFNWHDG